MKDLQKEKIKEYAEKHREQLIKIGEGMKVPHRTAAALARWAVYAGAGGHFITSVIKNDFAKAVTKADLENLKNIQYIALFVYNYLPDQCWGSEEKYNNWEGLYQMNLDKKLNKLEKELLNNETVRN